MQRDTKAFTLVELLVVIAIIALLMSVLVPSLRRAKDAARLVMCTANSKQISTLTGLFRTENDGYMPVLFSDAAPNVPAETRLLSLALRNYDPATLYLPEKFPPTGPQSVAWSDAGSLDRNEYFRQHLPKYYQCPLIRGVKGNGSNNWVDTGPVTINDRLYNTRARKAMGESYVTWYWPRAKGIVFDSAHPLGAPNGTIKYAKGVWNAQFDRFMEGKPAIEGYWQDAKGYRVRWDQSHYYINQSNRFEKRNTAPSELSVLMCFEGQLEFGDGYITNYGRHKKGGVGGTNMIFGDGHIEWVEGSRVGP